MRPIDPDRKAAAIALARDHGVTEAAKRTGIAKGAISKWCTAAGIETVSSDRNTKAIEQIRHNRTERTERLADRLLQIADLGTTQTIAMLQDASLRDVVGAWTRAIHDAQLLTGQATSRTETAEPREKAKTLIDDLSERRQRAIQ